jgi:cytochrome b subunit of formate dehydrogenase
MNLHFRIAHWLVVASFPVLVFTGFALKFPETWWARPLLVWEGSFAFRGLVHRVAGVVLVAALGYHVVHLLLVRRDRAILPHMIPGVGDLRDLVRMFAYNLGLADSPPTFGKFNYVEKVEYLAFLWGTAVMAATGFALWFNNVALRYFPKWFSDAATALHYYEAILATFSILIWHMYTVVFDPDVYPMDRAWLTGMASADHLRHTRPEYCAQLVKLQQQEAKQREEKEHAEPPLTKQSPGEPPKEPRADK